MNDAVVENLLFGEGAPVRLTKTTQPTVSDLVTERRIAESQLPQYSTDSRLPLMIYDDIAESDIYDPLDFKEVGERVRSNIVSAISKRFPVVSDKYTLTIENMAYDKSDSSLAAEKRAIQNEKNHSDRLKGDWVLYDNATGRVVQRRRETLMNVPRMTERGTFIRNGSELCLKHMFRLRPGLYARMKADGTPALQINPVQTTGRQMTINLQPDTGIFTVSRGTRTFGVLPLLRAAGVTDDEVKAAWGEELFNINANKYARILNNPDAKFMDEYRNLWNKDFKTIKLDPETTQETTGIPFKSLTKEALLASANKVLKLSRTASPDDEDDRDSLQFQRVMGPADYIPERIVRDGGGLIRKLVQRITKDGNLDIVEAGVFQPHIDSVFGEDRHAGYIDGASPFEGMDFSSSVSRLGEGGIGDTRAAPAETRGVNDSYLGFIDPIRSVESQKVGLEVYMTYGVKKDSKGNLYANFIDKTGKKSLRPMGLVAKSYVATPEYYDPNADPEEFIPVLAKGKGLEYVQRKNVDFYLASSNNMMSIGAGMIPAIGGIRSNRTLMGCLAPSTEVLIIRSGEHIVMTAEELLIDFREGDEVYSLADDNETIIKRPIRQVVKSLSTDFWLLETEEYKDIEVTGDHKWADHLVEPQPCLVKTKELNDEVGMFIPYWKGDLNVSNVEIDGTAVGVTSFIRVRPSVYTAKYPYSVDIDVDDNVYMLANGVFTHNSKYPLQALSLAEREAPLVQRAITLDDGSESTTEKYVAKQLGARFSPVSGRVLSVDADRIVVRGLDGEKHTIELYNDLPANQKGYITNTAVVKPGDSVTKNQCLAKSNYTDDTGTAALGKNLKVAFMTGRGATAFEDATVISQSCARKLASEQLYKYRGDLSSDVSFGKDKFTQLFGSSEYTDKQLEKIGADGFPEPGTVFEKGDPVFLGIQIRDLSSSGLSRTASVPYVKTWDHEEPGTVIDVVKGRKHMTVYTKCFTPTVAGDKLCFDEKTEVMTKRGWVLFKDLLRDDKVLTLDIQTGRNYFTDFEAAFRYDCEDENMYHITTKRVDLLVTKDHKHPVALMNNARYIAFQTSEEIYGKQRYFITGCNLESSSAYACTREDKAKERWEKYTGSVYCIMVPDTHTVFVRRNGKTVWSGNSGRYGNKAIVSAVIPDDKMPKSADGTPFDIIASPLSLPSRLNTSMLGEAGLAKIAKERGVTYTLPDFMEDTIPDFVEREMKKYGVSPTEDVYDPETGKTIPGVNTGYMFYYKLKHMGELKERGRGTGVYSAEEVPLKGEGAARRLGMMETSAVYSGGGMDVLRDAKLIRGQRNDEFWRDFRDGKTPDIPTTPLVHKKFFAHLVASGAKIGQPTKGAFSLATATGSDIDDLTQGRKVSKAATFNSKNMQPIDGGLFDPKIFGADGDQWGYVELPEPVLNPLMFKPIANILGWTDTELREYLQGSRKIDNEYGAANLIKRLNNIDLKTEFKKAKAVLKQDGVTLQQKDLARKRIHAIAPMLKQDTKPSDYFFNRMPILPPRFRQVTTINGGDTNIAADANFLYKRLMEASADLTEARTKLPEEFLVDAREQLYNDVNALIGLQPTNDPKLEAKGVSGLLKWAFGKGSPKLGSLHRKVFGSNLDLGGLGTIIPDSSLTIDQVGIPEESAWKMFEPFVVRELKGRGYSTLQAMKQVLERSPEAKRELIDVMKTRPILLNRAPTLWRYGIQGQMPVLVEGNAIRINPNICGVYNADFDGDSMSTHVPVSNEAVRAIKENMMPSKNLLSPKNFKAHFLPKDAANAGLYLASRIGAGEPIRFRTEEEAQEAFRKGEIKIDTPIIIGR